jgi:hypothetical protein
VVFLNSYIYCDTVATNSTLSIFEIPVEKYFKFRKGKAGRTTIVFTEIGENDEKQDETW